MQTAEEVTANITRLSGLADEVLGFQINASAVEGESADSILVYFNPNPESTEITLPEGKWNVYIDGEDAGTEVLAKVSGTITVDAISAMVLVQESGTSPALVIIAVLAVLAAGAAVAVVMKKKKAA